MTEFNEGIPFGFHIIFRTYGTWLHGHRRGSVNRFNNRFGTVAIAPGSLLVDPPRKSFPEFNPVAIAPGSIRRSTFLSVSPSSIRSLRSRFCISRPTTAGILATARSTQTKIGYQWQVIRSDQGEAAAMDRDIYKLERRIVVNVIEVQQRYYAGITARSTQSRSRFSR
jgi:hypothetical protein